MISRPALPYHLVGELQLRNAARKQAQQTAGLLAEQDTRTLHALKHALNFLLSTGKQINTLS